MKWLLEWLYACELFLRNVSNNNVSNLAFGVVHVILIRKGCCGVHFRCGGGRDDVVQFGAY